jgi:hypothetical protein
MITKEVYQYKRGCLITIGGSTHRKTGTGKSWTALKMAEYVDKDYQHNADKVVYFVKDFLKILDQVEETKRFGQMIVIDEAGSLLASDKWQSIVNKAVSYTAQTFRYLRAGMVLVMPQRRLIDKNVRTMADYHITMRTSFTKDGLQYLATPYAMKYEEFNDETYRRSLYGMLMNRGRKIVKLKDVPTSPIFSQALIDDYEKKSIQFKKQLRGLLADDIASYEKQIKRSMPYTDLTTISDTLSKDEDFISSIVRNRKVDKDLLETNLDMSFPDYNFSSKDVNLIKKLVEKSLGGV